MAYHCKTHRRRGYGSACPTCDPEGAITSAVVTQPRRRRGMPCLKCGAPTKRSGRIYCSRACGIRYGSDNSAWKGGVSKNHIRYVLRFRERYPEKYAAHLAVAKAVRSGHLKRLPCEICGATTTEAHHSDYSKPLEVRWLCDRCHKDVHREVVESRGIEPLTS